MYLLSRLIFLGGFVMVCSWFMSSEIGEETLLRR